MAETLLERFATRARFGATQGARVAWYGAHSFAMRRQVRRIEKSLDAKPPEHPPLKGPVPDQRRLFADVADLLAKDLQNVEQGLYPIPKDEPGGLAGLVRRSRLFFDDLPEVTRRRLTGAHQEVFAEGRDHAGEAETVSRPRYYMQNFHFQTDGWMSERSADLYDTQVEVLFLGAAAAMRRQALVPIATNLAKHDQRQVAYADIACGNGGFLKAVKDAFPRLPAVGFDLSDAYCAAARKRTRGHSRIAYAVANAERLPLADESLDIVSNVYLFHELPPKIRPVIASELARITKAGGRLVLMDSLQTGDVPDYNGLLELFPRAFHEPYYGSYLETDLESLFEDAGFELESRWTAF
ncbi:MAG: class I SAM-dependent methyltransferase, partial [Pseudomonadota bacterium]